MDEGVHVVDGVLRKPSVGGEAVGAVSLVVFAVIHAIVQTGRIHAHAAPFATATPRVDLHGNAIAEGVFIDPRAEFDNGARYTHGPGSSFC